LCCFFSHPLLSSSKFTISFPLTPLPSFLLGPFAFPVFFHQNSNLILMFLLVTVSFFFCIFSCTLTFSFPLKPFPFNSVHFRSFSSWNISILFFLSYCTPSFFSGHISILSVIYLFSHNFHFFFLFLLFPFYFLLHHFHLVIFLYSCNLPSPFSFHHTIFPFYPFPFHFQSLLFLSNLQHFPFSIFPVLCSLSFPFSSHIPFFSS